MIKIDSFIKKNGSNSSSSNGGGGFANGTTTTVQKELETHKIWGQNFNGTQDVDGDMTVNGNVSISGNVTATNGAITNIESESITNVGTITTDTVDAANIKGANANISNQLNVKDILSTDITTDYLTVTKSAHFWELVVDKISSTKGAIIVSPANCIIEDIENNNGTYTLYWRAEDKETGKAITNDFNVNDQIICQSFNAANDTDFNVSNKFYWRLVTNVGRTYRADSLRGGECYWNYIQLSATDGDGDSLPEIGDNIAVLGNRTNEDRQNAIIISSTNSDYLDADIQAPSIVQYKGIKSYNLQSYRYNVIAANGNTFIGNFKVVASDGSLGDIESGKDGKGIKSIVTHYLASNLSSGMGKTTVWDSGSVIPPTLTVTKPYMWQQAKTTYTDNTYTLSLPVMIGANGKDGQSTQYINIIAECATEDFNGDNNTGHSYTSNVYMDGKLLAYGSVRGHTMLVVDPTTKSVINTYQYDTYYPDNATTAVNNLITKIDNVANDKIIIITSHDATSCNQNLRDKLSNDYNSNIPSNAEVWTSERYSHAIIIFKHSNREHQCFEQFNHFKPSYLTVYYTSDNMSLAGKDGNNGIMDKLSMTKARATVNINDDLYVFNEGYVNHIDGDRITRVSDLSKYYLKIIDSNGRTVINTPSAGDNTFIYNSRWQQQYSEQENRITHFRLQLYDTSDNLLDEITYNVTFDAGAVLTVGQNAITSSVQQSKTYTDGQISTVKQTADGIASRVTKIEGDYVTESEMNQTVNNISLNVYDNLKNKTGIDVTTGKIVLDADNVQVKGNFNLTDTSNGLTVYDAANTPLINLQPTPISKIGTFKNDRLMTTNLTMTSVSGGSSIVVQTNKSSAITLKKGDVIRLSNIRYTIYANDGTTIYPRDLYLTGGVRIYNGKGETVLNSSAQFNRNNNYGTYQLNTSVTYRTTADDNYTVNLFITTPSTWSTSYTVSGYGNTRIETGSNVQSYIGSDGAFFHNAANKLIYSAEDELRLQFGYNGVRWSDDTEYYNKAMEVLCNVKSNTDGTYSPLYLPFYNFTPTTQSFTFKYQRVVNIGSNKYAHNIMPSTDKGILLLDTPAVDSNGNYQETWFVLPSESFGSRDGKILFSLPIGYTVKIINNTGGKANVFVTPSASNKNEGVIYTSENAKVNYLKLTGDNSMKTFMYVGGYGTESGTTWRVID
ncbi:hypothetical protein I6E49_03330 [Prevotella stercorea]|uniref:interleukin-like EMT inducer domain-containing protein n=1 Tax=Leyella stercorea TaxID=363265 RepID=UPI001F26C9C2|nr:interleukin-like EMT inducer domain-containing protein [Leyella stercorea]MCF2644348.1 hypothetical protein [Leyella stercorea]